MCTSTASISGSTATVAVLVWMRPPVSVSGTRWTRCTPLSNFRREYAPCPLMSRLASRLYAAESARQSAERSAERRSQVGTGMRNERIRTYNFPQGRVTDHRIGLTLYKLNQVLDGDLDEIIDALTLADQAEKLRASVEEA